MLEGKGLPEKPRPRREDNIKRDITFIGLKTMDLIHVAQDIYCWRFLVKNIRNYSLYTPGRVHYNASILILRNTSFKHNENRCL
jgi:hypothetical protein